MSVLSSVARIPAFQAGGRGSIPRERTFGSIRKSVPVAKWIRRWFPEPKIEGSSPFRDVRTYGLVGYDVCLTRRRSPVRSWAGVFATLILHFSVLGALRSECAGLSTVKISFSTLTSPLGLMDKACPS